HYFGCVAELKMPRAVPVSMSTFVLAIIFGLLATTAGAAQDEGPLIRVAETSLRRAATRMVMPEYPKGEEQLNGVAVAEITTDVSGNLSRVDILEAPSKSAADSMKNAISQWKFKLSYRDGKAVRYLSKLTFYFSYNHGKRQVRNPKVIEK